MPVVFSFCFVALLQGLLRGLSLSRCGASSDGIAAYIKRFGHSCKGSSIVVPTSIWNCTTSQLNGKQYKAERYEKNVQDFGLGRGVELLCKCILLL